MSPPRRPAQLWAWAGVGAFAVALGVAAGAGPAVLVAFAGAGGLAAARRRRGEVGDGTLRALAEPAEAGAVSLALAEAGEVSLAEAAEAGEVSLAEAGEVSLAEAAEAGEVSLAEAAEAGEVSLAEAAAPAGEEAGATGGPGDEVAGAPVDAIIAGVWQSLRAGQEQLGREQLTVEPSTLEVDESGRIHGVAWTASVAVGAAGERLSLPLISVAVVREPAEVRVGLPQLVAREEARPASGEVLGVRDPFAAFRGPRVSVLDEER